MCNMDNLNHNWLTDNLIDFEYKKYILLSYLKTVNEKFRVNELYPQLADLLLHYQNLNNIKNNKEVLYNQFPKQLKGLDIEKLELDYKVMIEDDDLMKEINDIINYSMPQIHKAINEGKNIYDFVEDNLEVDTVGLIPIYNKEGYMLLTQESKKYLKVYRYKVSMFEHHEENFSSISTTYISSEMKTISRTVESVKLDLIKRFKELPNPATFLFTSRLKFPLKETFLPVAKRLLMRQVDTK
ncbi:MAG: hypothetical protein ACJA2S_002851 [Cyclobacteriaceae bacterium]|jgi:hypothetical protein